MRAVEGRYKTTMLPTGRLELVSVTRGAADDNALKGLRVDRKRLENEYDSTTLKPTETKRMNEETDYRDLALSNKGMNEEIDYRDLALSNKPVNEEIIYRDVALSRGIYRLSRGESK